MLTEHEIICMVDPILRARSRGVKTSFENDAERFDVDTNRLLVTTDGFSGEDLFCEDNPGKLGWNLAVAAITDVLAAGGTPKYYTHSMVIAKLWDRRFVTGMAQGIARALSSSKMTFVGGDTGLSGQWHYTATVLGEASDRPLNRRGARPGDVIYLSGQVGTGNLQAAMRLFAKKLIVSRAAGAIDTSFHLRISEAAMLRIFATSCIDTSDGVFNALNMISDINGTGYNIESPPYVKAGVILAKALSLPVALLLLGECGEYELLFTIASDNEKRFLQEARAKKMRFHRLGTVTEDSAVRLLNEGRIIDLSGQAPRGRDYEKPTEYLSELSAWLKRRM